VTASATATQIRTDSPTPIVTAAGPPCRTSQLEAAFASVNGAAGTLIFIFEFRNTSDATCYLSGYASVALQDEYGDAIDLPSSTVGDVGEPVVNLTPKSADVPSLDNELTTTATGHAFASFFFGHCGSTGFSPVKWLIMPPGETEPLAIAGPTQFGNGYPICVSSGPMVWPFSSKP